MRPKLAIALRIFSTFISHSKEMKPTDKFAMAAFVQSNAVRVIGRSRSRAGTYSVIRGERVHLQFDHWLHRHARCWLRRLNRMRTPQALPGVLNPRG